MRKKYKLLQLQFLAFWRDRFFTGQAENLSQAEDNSVAYARYALYFLPLIIYFALFKWVLAHFFSEQHLLLDLCATLGLAFGAFFLWLVFLDFRFFSLMREELLRMKTYTHDSSKKIVLICAFFVLLLPFVYAGAFLDAVHFHSLLVIFGVVLRSVLWVFFILFSFRLFFAIFAYTSVHYFLQIALFALPITLLRIIALLYTPLPAKIILWLSIDTFASSAFMAGIFVLFSNATQFVAMIGILWSFCHFPVTILANLAEKNRPWALGWLQFSKQLKVLFADVTHVLLYLISYAFILLFLHRKFKYLREKAQKHSYNNMLSRHKNLSLEELLNNPQTSYLEEDNRTDLSHQLQEERRKNLRHIYKQMYYKSMVQSLGYDYDELMDEAQMHKQLQDEYKRLQQKVQAKDINEVEFLQAQNDLAKFKEKVGEIGIAILEEKFGKP
jgi:hypothetical protein